MLALAGFRDRGPTLGEQHADLLAVAPVLLAELRDQVALLEPMPIRM